MNKFIQKLYKNIQIPPLLVPKLAFANQVVMNKLSFILSQTIIYFLVILFVYTGVSKLLDTGIFISQIAQSNMLAPYAKFLALVVPIIELGLAIALLIPHLRIKALLGSYFLMLSFSIYVYLIWMYSPNIPCSCGGILEAMDWEAHLYFNGALTFLAGLAWKLEQAPPISYKHLLIGSLLAISLVLALFFLQPQPKLLEDHSFSRSYYTGEIKEIASQKLAYNSYYLAGVKDSLVYLGNSTGFTHGLVWNYHTSDTLHFKIELPDAPESFKALPKWKVYEGYFYMAEGVTPSIYKGKVDEWIAKEFMPQVPYFSDWVAIDSTRFILRALQASTQKYVLVDYKDTEPYVTIHNVLVQENENLFEVDGNLIWNTKKQQIGYLYFYKNQLPSWNLNFSKVEKLDLLYASDLAEIQTNKGRDGTHLRDNPTSALHSKAIAHNDHWFVHSQVLGKGDIDAGMQKYNLIDVYHNDTGYKYSIAIPRRNGVEIREFYINDIYLIALYPNELVVYMLNNFFMAMKKQEKPNT